jgi:hypothetical protein
MLTIFLVIICVLRDRRPFLANWGHAVPSSLTLLPCRTPSTKRYEKRDPFTPPGYHPNHIDAQLLSQSLSATTFKSLNHSENHFSSWHLRNVRDRIRWKSIFLESIKVFTELVKHHVLNFCWCENCWNWRVKTFSSYKSFVENLKPPFWTIHTVKLTYCRVLNLYKKTATIYLDFLWTTLMNRAVYWRPT